MRLVYFGDVMGKSGRIGLDTHLPLVMDRLSPDFVIANGENAAHGFGITEKICAQFFNLGVDVITTGNHAWDQREIINFIDTEPRLLRPLNYPASTPGNGSGIFEARNGAKVFVGQVMGRLFMDSLDDPFSAMDKVLSNSKMGDEFDCAVVDIHAEATSEKMAMGQYLNGRVSMVVGTHSHVPTADAQIFSNGTAYQTDLGMCGDYDSVIGMKPEAAIGRFMKRMPLERLSPSDGIGTVCGVFLESDDNTGRALRLEPIRIGGRLIEHIPKL
ncbi:MAG: TIGR00282 family metallophosphoesterase [Pseudomonadota bacterium]|nr:TIGR00282 family metallophosphoesterase [Pseudomonadota bacterium]